LNALGLASFLAGGTLDAQLAQCVVLADGTPEGLAEFAAKGEQQAALLDALLADTELMKLMLMADGPNAPRVGRGYGPAQYGPAMEIYTGIQKTAVT